MIANGMASRERLFRRFTELGIEAPTIPYPAHATIEEGKALRAESVFGYPVRSTGSHSHVIVPQINSAPPGL
jgi:hypothetical protein